MKNLQAILDKSIRNKHLYGISLSVSKGGEQWSGYAGNLGPTDQYFIASTTKLFTSSLIFMLRNEGKLKLEDKISDYLSTDCVEGVHVLKGKDYSEEITIENLLAHTSGLPDYFQSKSHGNKPLENYLMEGNDFEWDFDQVLEWAKEMSPKFPPSTQGKSHYSDTNYQLLGRIVENLYGDSLENLIDEKICKPLGLKHTYLYSDPKDSTPRNIYFKSNELIIPKAMTSFKADGGVVSTSDEMTRFIKGFISGELFPESYIQEIQQWNKVFFPLEAGIGIKRFNAPWYFSPFNKVPEIIGHSGLSGAFAFYAPELDVFLTGTVNQIHNPGNSFKLLIKVLLELKKAH